MGAARGREGKEWRPHGRDFDSRAHQETLLRIFDAVRSAADWGDESLMRILAQHPKGNKASLRNGESGFFAKIELVLAYKELTAAGALPFERETLRRLRMKPVRTSSGVAPVTVLTKPAGCPGRCSGQHAQELSAERAGRAAGGAMRLRSVPAGDHAADRFQIDGARGG
ncbi:MAG: hypothetical protein MUC34_09800 [Anaerolineae bacterium]|nr:hypothetical protein [Anaerolineae bacterium]